MNVLVLGTANQYITEAAHKTGCTVTAYEPLDLYLLISESVKGYDRVYDGRPGLEKPVRLKVKDFDCLLPRLSGQLETKSVILEHLNSNLGIYSPQKAEALRCASNKVRTTMKLSQAGIRVPKTVWAEAPAHIGYIIEDMMGGLPLVAKTVHGSQGAGVSILETPLAANTALESFYNNKVDLKLQRFVDAKASDIRAIVVGDRVVCAMERTANKGDFRANLSKGGSGRTVKLSADDEEMAVKASKAVGLEYSGVDLMKDADGTSYVIEVNGNPGTGIIGITGVNFFIDLLTYCKQEKKRGSWVKEGYQVEQSIMIYDEGKQYIAHLSGGVAHVVGHPDVLAVRSGMALLMALF